MTAISAMSVCSSSGPTDPTRSSRRATTLRNVSSSSCGAHDLVLAHLLRLLTLHHTQTPPQAIPSFRSTLGAPQPPASGVSRLGGTPQERTRSRTSRKLWLMLPASREQYALLNVDGTESGSLSKKSAYQMLGTRLSLRTLQRSGLRCSTPHCTTVLPLGFHSVSRLASHSLTC
jgi:hypothetical protein